MRNLLLAFFILLIYSCSEMPNDDYSVYSINYTGGKNIDNNKISFYLNYNIPSENFKENNHYILRWSKIGNKGIWNGLIVDSLKIKSGSVNLVSDLSLIKSDLTKNDTILFMFSLNRKITPYNTVRITESGVISYYPN